MESSERRAGLYPALIKHWRGQRGLSQLDLALAADVSARHISFLETGRSKPSAEMVVQLGLALGVELRRIDEMLVAAGYPPHYGAPDEQLPTPVVAALQLLKDHHEPFPVIVLDRAYEVVDLNSAATNLLATLLPDFTPTHLNLAELTFDPRGAHPLIANFDQVGRDALWRIQREALANPHDREINDLLTRLLTMPTVDPQWRSVDLSAPSEAAILLHLRHRDADLRFMTLVTAFQAPQNSALEALRIETWFPYDPPTRTFCERTARLRS